MGLSPKRVLVNQRTQESHFYSVAGATEDSAMESAEGQVQNLRYTSHRSGCCPR